MDRGKANSWGSQTLAESCSFCEGRVVDKLQLICFKCEGVQNNQVALGEYWFGSGFVLEDWCASDMLYWCHNDAKKMVDNGLPK